MTNKQFVDLKLFLTLKNNREKFIDLNRADKLKWAYLLFLCNKKRIWQIITTYKSLKCLNINQIASVNKLNNDIKTLSMVHDIEMIRNFYKAYPVKLPK